MSFRRLSSLLLCALPVAACVLKADGFTGGPGTPSPDAASDSSTTALDSGSGGVTPDSGVDGDAKPGDDLPPHGPNLIANADFELFCAGWGAFNAQLYESSLSRSGTGACRVCTNQDSGNHLFVNVKRDLKAGEKYYAEIWFRAEPNEAAVAPRGGLQLSLHGETGDQTQDRSGAPNPTETYARISTLLTTSRVGFELNLDLELVGSKEKCALIDDATLVQLQ